MAKKLTEMQPADLGADAEGFEVVNQGQTPTMVPDGSEVSGEPTPSMTEVFVSSVN